MSEQYIYVACRCFRDGLVSAPPVSRSDLRIDAFGNLAPAAGGSADDFSETLYDWMSDGACEHADMREIELIFHPHLEYSRASLRTDRELRNPRLVGELDSGRYPDLTAFLIQFPHAHGVVASPHQASAILDDLDRLAAHRLPGRTRVLIDERGDRMWPTIDPEGFDGGETFTSVYGDPRPDLGRDDLLEIGVSGDDVVIRSWTSGEELLRGRTVTQAVDDSERIRVGYRSFKKVRFGEPATGAAVEGYGVGVGVGSLGNLHEPVHAHARTIRVSQIPLVMTDTAYFPRILRAVLAVCLSTGNPVVTYYSGSSLGFDGADRARRCMENIGGTGAPA